MGLGGSSHRTEAQQKGDELEMRVERLFKVTLSLDVSGAHPP